MKIAYVTADFGVPVLGTKGASVHVRQMVGALTRAGHEVLVITPSPAQGLDEMLGCEVAEMPLAGTFPLLYEELKRETMCDGNRLPKDIRNLMYAVWLEMQASPLLDQFEPDFIYERYSLFGTAGIQLARRCDVPLVLEVNAPLVDEQKRHRGLSLPQVARATERLIMRSADHVIVVSRPLHDHVVAQGASPERVTVMFNAADPETFRPHEGRSNRRHWLQWKDELVFGFVGSMKQWHGVPILIETLERLGGMHSPFRLLLVGDGPELATLKRTVRERGLQDAVHFTGAVPHDLVPEWTEAMDVAVAPYPDTGEPYFSPVKIFEYMSMARPVVAAAVGQSIEIIEPGRTGWLYKPGDAGDLARRLEWVAANREEATQVGLAAREQVLDQHTWGHNAERVVEIAAELRGRDSVPVITTTRRAGQVPTTAAEKTEGLC